MNIKEQQGQSLERFGIVSVVVETQPCVGGKIVQNLAHTHMHIHSHARTREIQEWWLGISRRKPLYIEWINNKVLQYSVYVCAVAQSCLTFCNPMDRSTPGSSVLGIFQARMLEWVAISSSSRGSS